MCHCPTEANSCFGASKVHDFIALRLIYFCREAVMYTVNSLKPSFYFVYHQVFYIKELYVPPTQCVYDFCMYPWTNSDLFPKHHQLIDFCNRDGGCLLRGTTWVFIIQVNPSP
jgi:hypothetical protein